MKQKILVFGSIIISILLLIGCATSANYQKILDTWIGASESSLVSTWGPPQNAYRLSDGGAVIVGPPFIDFVYDHANPSCPLPIDPVSVTGPVGGEWMVTTDPPVWMDFPSTSGTIPGTIDMNFPCRLDRYENQEQSETFTVEVKMPDGSTQEYEFEVNGKFINF